MKKKNNRIGQKFNMLTIIEYVEPHIQNCGAKVIMCKCKCDCGNEKIIRERDIVCGHTKSCGCIAGKTKTKNHGKNKFDLTGDCGIGYDSTGVPFYFDKEDFPLIAQYTWWTGTGGYLRSDKKKGGERVRVQMHRLVMGMQGKDENLYIDHLNHNVRDNRKCNLAVKTNSENQQNRLKKQEDYLDPNDFYDFY